VIEGIDNENGWRPLFRVGSPTCTNKIMSISESKVIIASNKLVWALNLNDNSKETIAQLNGDSYC